MRNEPFICPFSAPLEQTPRCHDEVDDAHNIALYLDTGKHPVQSQVIPLWLGQQLETQLAAATQHGLDLEQQLAAKSETLERLEAVHENTIRDYRLELTGLEAQVGRLRTALEAIVAFRTPLPCGLLEQARAALDAAHGLEAATGAEEEAR